jgi:hypothetical protein
VAVAPNGAIYVAGYTTDGADTYWVVRKSVDRGDSWTAVDTFQLNAGETSSANAIAIDSSGKIYAVGTGVNSAQTYWVVRASSDDGASWTTIDQLQLNSGKTSNASSVALDSNGNVFVAGYGIDSSNIINWVVRKSGNGGASWSTPDSYQYSTGKNSDAHAISVDSSGAVYVAGEGIDASSNTHWIVRKSTDAGSTWSIADDYQREGNESSAFGISTNSSGKVVVTGWTVVSGSSYVKWVVRYSGDGGGSWSDLDFFGYASAQNTASNAAILESSGAVTVAGYGKNELGTVTHWLTRSASSVSGSWSTADDYPPSSGNSAIAYALGVTNEGDLLAVGGTSQWVVRKQRCIASSSSED